VGEAELLGERLSSWWTGYHKYFPGFLAAVAALTGIVLSFYVGYEPLGVAFLFGVVGLLSFLWTRRLRNVRLLGDCLVVELRGISHHVHVSRIERVRQTRWRQPPVVTVTLKERGPVGAKVEFIPKGMIIHGLDDGPVTLRLQELAEDARHGDCVHVDRGA
jgi:hypothetical protein